MELFKLSSGYFTEFKNNTKRMVQKWSEHGELFYDES